MGRDWERTVEKRGEQRGDRLAGKSGTVGQVESLHNCREIGRVPRATAGGGLGRQGAQEGRDRLEWGQEGGAVLGRPDREKDGNGLAPRYKQAPPCHRTVGSMTGRIALHLPIHSQVECPVCRYGAGAGGGGGGLGEKMQLHPASCSSPSVPHFPSSRSTHRVLSL